MTFNVIGAVTHEQSPAHRNEVVIRNLADGAWPMVVDDEAWGSPPAAVEHKPRKRRLKKSQHPLHDMVEGDKRQNINRGPAHQRFRVRSWMKSVVLASGGAWIETEEDVEPPDEDFWEVGVNDDNAWAQSWEYYTATTNSAELRQRSFEQYGDVVAASPERPPSIPALSCVPETEREQEFNDDGYMMESASVRFDDWGAEDDVMPTEKKRAHIRRLIKQMNTKASPA